jgi:exopolysaccharide biosynthesis polyprenyl glycosylphosphotransferase
VVSDVGEVAMTAISEPDVAEALAPAPVTAPAARLRWFFVLSTHSKLVLRLVDGLAAVLAVLLVAPAFSERGPQPAASWAVVAGTLFVASGTVAHLYQARFTEMQGEELRRIVAATALTATSLVTTGWALAIDIERAWLAAAMLAAAGAVTAERQVARAAFRSARRRGLLLREVAIIGRNGEANALRRVLEEDPTTGYRVVTVIDPGSGGDPTIGAERIVARTVASGSTTALVAASAIDTELSTRLLRRLAEAGIHVEMTSTLRDVDHRRLRVRPIGPFPVMYVEPVVRHGWRTTAKRAFDVAGASLGLVALTPLLAVVALAVKLDSRGPVFFGQTRVGRGNRPFRIWKFRTMVADADALRDDLAALNQADGPLFKIDHDPRVTRVGRLLRRTSIDELPQLWNVLRNDMSLVGPRPGLPSEAVHWDAELRERLRVKPGITGMWQVHGRSDASFDEYARLDLYYVHNWSLLVDLGILARTVPTVLWSKGAY